MLAAAGSGARLEVDLLARRSSIAGSGGATVRVGRLVRNGAALGRVSFKVALSPAARRALHARGRLAVDVRVLLTPATGAGVAISRRVVLHA